LTDSRSCFWKITDYEGAGEVRFTNGATLTHNSTFDIQTDEYQRQYGGATSTFINNGTVRKTTGTGTTNIETHFTNAGTVEKSSSAVAFGQTYVQIVPGAIYVRIGGSTPTTDFDRYVVSQEATLSGTLVFTLINAYKPSIGDKFEIMTFSSRTGSFATINGLAIGNGNCFDLIYGTTNVITEVVPE
jgi:hypothetical protein